MKSIIFWVILIILLAAFALGAWFMLFNKQEDLKISKSGVSVDTKIEGKLHVTMINDFPPMEFLDESGELVGYDVAVVKEVAKQLGLEIEIDQKKWKELFDIVKNGETDIIISSITITDERQEEMLFSSPYFDAGQVIVVRKENNEIKKPADLEGKKVGVNKGTTCEKAALEYASRESVIAYDGYDLVVENLVSGKIDAMVLDIIGGLGYEKEYPDDLKVVGDSFTQEYYGMATKKGNEQLMDEINKIIRDLKREGKLNEFKNKWLK